MTRALTHAKVWPVPPGRHHFLFAVDLPHYVESASLVEGSEGWVLVDVLVGKISILRAPEGGLRPTHGALSLPVAIHVDRAHPLQLVVENRSGEARQLAVFVVAEPLES